MTWWNVCAMMIWFNAVPFSLSCCGVVLFGAVTAAEYAAFRYSFYYYLVYYLFELELNTDRKK